MTLFIDCEYNGYGGRLISLALVSDKGGEFYGVLDLPSKIDPWVAEHVVPFLVKDAEDYNLMRFRLKHFLEKHEGETIVADWPEDFMHLMNCMCEPNGVSFQIEMDMRLVNSGELKPDVPHNALSDARALMHWYVAERKEVL